MKLIKGLIDYTISNQPTTVILFTANSVVKNNGELVMGAGNAKAARDNFIGSAKTFGNLVTLDRGRHVHVVQVPNRNVFLGCFRTKEHYKDNTKQETLTRSIQELQYLANNNPQYTFLLPAPAIGRGGMAWDAVRPQLECLPDNVYVVKG